MERYENLTNESLNNKFESQFELVIFAIEVAKEMIQSGRGPRVITEAQNPAHWVLEEILEDKAVLENILVSETLSEELIIEEETFEEHIQNAAVG